MDPGLTLSSGFGPVPPSLSSVLMFLPRSSVVRNVQCPMCGESPRLKEVMETVEEETERGREVNTWRSHGDGFTL